DLVALVELVGFARRKRQGNVGFSRRARVLLAPAPRIAANRVVAALVAERPQLLVNADQRQPLARRRLGVRRQQPVERLRPRPELRPRLDLAVIRKRRLPRPQDPSHRIARQMQAPRDLLDRLPLAQMLAPYPTDRLHNQHPPPPASRQSRQPTKPEIGGSILDADDAPQGVNFARRNTHGLSSDILIAGGDPCVAQDATHAVPQPTVLWTAAPAPVQPSVFRPQNTSTKRSPSTIMMDGSGTEGETYGAPTIAHRRGAPAAAGCAS